MRVLEIHLSTHNIYQLIFTLSLLILLTACGGGGGSSTPAAPTPPIKGANFTTFETGQVRPLAMSPNGSRLFATNTPNGTLEIFAIGASGALTYESTVAVGMEPSAVAALNDDEVWVVNHLSDSISIVDVSVTPPKVTRTLFVGDEPRDIVFAGTTTKFAFITTAHRGQNSPYQSNIHSELTTEGKDRADVWVFDTTNLGTALGGTRNTIVTLFGDTPRALTVSPDGNTVYAAVFFSGNKTTTLGEDNLSKAGPTINMGGVPQPDTGLIVQFNGTNWVDATGSTTDLGGAVTYDDKVRFTLPDYDVFAIDASLATPALTGTPFTGVGTTLFNMVANPDLARDTIYVANTNALNLTRFEGPGNAASTVRGHFVESQITVIKSGVVTPRHLNKHINYNSFPGTQTERDLAVSSPLDMAVSSDGNTLYASGFGSQKIAIYDTAALEADTFTPSTANLITLTAGGPTGVVLNEARNRLYTLTRFDNGISTIDTTAKNEIAHLTMHNPEPDHVVTGRPFLYDAANTSSHGDSSCGLCHVFGDFDGLAWDLGNPDDVVASNPNGFVTQPGLRPLTPVFHPMKGPMSTQSLRGLAGNGPMHWRGDRTGAATGNSLELRAFKDFNVAFPGLVGNDTELPDADMQAFAEFSLALTYPPNPIRALNNVLSPTEDSGKNIFTNDFTTGPPTFGLTCNICHQHNPVNGNFGTAGLSTVEGPDVSQEMKVPHLRNMYQKVGKFGHSGKFATDPTLYGDQIKGFGFMHDGGMDTLDNFLQGQVFRFSTDPTLNDIFRRNVIQFMMVMDSEMAPIVGQQITLTASSPASVDARIVLLRNQAMVPAPRAECDLIVKGVIGGITRGYLMQNDGSYQSDRATETLTDTGLRDLVNTGGQTLTFTCVPPGSGTWMGIDHDEDGEYDRDELDEGTDPLTV